jgi:ankyrin repeat protein
METCPCLPLHLACMHQASLDVVRALVEMHPTAVKTANNDGNLPLHLACMHQASLDMVRALAEIDPDAVETVNNDGNLALHLAYCSHAAP